MSLGMSYEDFWHGDVALVGVYRKADELKRQRQNEVLWTQGLYIRDALLCTVGNMLAGKKGNKFDYPKEPYAITATEIREREEREARLRQERMKAEFAAFAERMRKKMPVEAHPDSKGGEVNEYNDR